MLLMTITRINPASLVLLFGGLLFAAPAAVERISDPANRVSLELPEGWTAVRPEAAREALRSLSGRELRIVGIDQSKTVLLAVDARDAQDIIPHISVSVADVGGLGLSDADLEELESELERLYSEQMGGRFKLLTLKGYELGGLRAARVTGIYRWRTVNIKILQYLVPGTDRLYAVTYTAKEREFRRSLSAAEAAMGTLIIADPPLRLEWLWESLRWATLLILVAGILWLTIIATSSRPGKGRGGAESLAASQFLRKR